MKKLLVLLLVMTFMVSASAFTIELTEIPGALTRENITFSKTYLDNTVISGISPTTGLPWEGVYSPIMIVLDNAPGAFPHWGVKDADVFLLVTEKGDVDFDESFVTKLNSLQRPIVALLNKVDLCEQEEVVGLLNELEEKFPTAIVIPVSALHKFNLDRVFDTLLEKLPLSPPYYPKDELTDRSIRFFVSEIIREKILLYFKQEIPYSVEVAVDEYKEMPHITRISATIYVARESQKAIILGHQGRSIKGLGMAARKDIEEFIEGKSYLELRVKVSKDWRDDPQQLKRFGYDL